MINIGKALEANLRATLSVDSTGSVPALHLRISYGDVTICDAEVDLPVAGGMADERQRAEDDAIAEARRIADAHGRAAAETTLAAEAGRRKVVEALGLGPGAWSWHQIADAIMLDQHEIRALKASVIRLKAEVLTLRTEVQTLKGERPITPREGGL